MPLLTLSQETDSSPKTSFIDYVSGGLARSFSSVKETMQGEKTAEDGRTGGNTLSPSAAISNASANGTSKAQKTTPSRPSHTASGSKQTSHLPTPQSPNSISSYADSLTFGEDSPLYKPRHNSRTSSQNRAQTPTHEHTVSPASVLMTPESSPIFIRRSRTSHASSSSSPPTTPRRARPPDSPEYRSFATPRPPIRSLSVPHTLDSSPHSGLSSPFVDMSKQKMSVETTPQHSREHSPMLVHDVLSSPAVIPPPLSAPIPQRAIGSEIQRIRLQMAADQAARLEESEARRPDYLKRTKRPSSGAGTHAIAIGDQENTQPALGVVDSPVKGRRLALFQETSEESFEQSLLAGGYPLYGHAPAYGEPTTPRQNGKTSQVLEERDVNEIPPSEKDLLKRRRLAAFRDLHSHVTQVKLYPVTIEGIGRVLLDHIPPDAPAQIEAPPKKRGGRKRKGAPLESPAKRVTASPGKRSVEPPSQEGEFVKPNWPDQAFPWSMRSQQRAEYAKKEEEERLRWIERYLDRDSDEDEDTEDQSLRLPHVEEKVTPRRGRGKMVPLPSNPDDPKGDAKREHTLIPSDPADARAALLSKRSVRALAFRRRQEEKDTVCICHGRDDGRELVQCDDCHKWFHLECIGIHDITALGREEDPWYCDQCLGVVKPVLSSPTFVPTDDRLPVNGRRDLLFLPGNVQESPPAIPVRWASPLQVPRTPVRGQDTTHTFSSRSSIGDSSQAGPQTPSTSARSVRVYNTPGPVGFLESLDEPFDPTSTPSRGMKFSGPFTTPKAPSLWGYRGGFTQTPSRSGRKFSGGSFPFAFDSNDASSPRRTVYTNEESPVRRSSTKPSVLRRPPDSPLSTRSSNFPVFGTHESLAARRSSIENLQNGDAAP